MWEMRMARPFGRISIRNLFVFVAGLLAAAFSLALLTTSTAHAAPDAHWEDTQISYKDDLYTRTDDGKTSDPRGVPEGAFVFENQVRTAVPWTMRIIYFEKDVDLDTAKEAMYRTMAFQPQYDDDRRFTNLTEPKTITLQPYKTAEEPTTSCVQDGIGWIICPLTNWLAEGMDYLYKALSGFLEVRPAQTNTENPLYRAWSFMRNTANVLFVIGFLIIIYSQITSFGLSNYNIKKMLPRLVIAAILVNISYWICAIAIDISNILGYSIQDIFMNIRENLVGPEGNTWELISWQSITGVVLSGGAGAAALGFGAASFAAGAGSAIYFLVPILVSILMTVLVALLIMAARQAIITILLVISPLAFVAFLLPNTEKYFEKWRSLGMTMLIMFPAFSVIFGGSQLAGALIIQNADSINLVILGLAVQVAPLIITPLLIRFSGSLLGRIAGMVNDPNKGAIDRSRKWAEDRAGKMKSNQIANGKGFLARRARGFDRRRRNREGWQKANDSLAEANWSNDMPKSRAHDIHQRAMEAADIKSTGENLAQEAYNKRKATDAKSQDIDIQARAAKLKVDLSQAKIDANWEEIQAGDTRNIVTPQGLSVNALANYANDRNNTAKSIHQTALQNSIESRRAHSAQYVQKQSFAKDMLGSEVLQRQAGGVAGHEGAESALAAAVTAKRSAYADSVKEATQILKHFNLDGSQRQKLALGQAVTVSDMNGNVKTFDHTSTYAIEAALEMQLGGAAKYEQIEEIISKSGSDLKEFATTISGAIVDYKLASKSVFLGGQTINDVSQGLIRNDADLDKAVALTIAKGKVEPSHLAHNDADSVKRLVRVAAEAQEGNTFGITDPTVIDNLIREIGNLKHSAVIASTSSTLKGDIAANTWPHLENLVGHSLRPNSGNPTPES